VNVKKRQPADSQMFESFQEELFNVSPVFFVIIGIDGNTIMMNKTMLTALGYSAGEVLNQNYLSTFVPAADHAFLSGIFKQIKKGENTFNENCILTKDGRKLSVEWYGCPMANPQGEIDTFFGVGIDITERKQAEAELQLAFDEIRSLKEQLEAENIYLREEIRMAHLHGDIVGQSKAIISVMAQAEQVAGTDSTALIMGETGTGKGLLARAIHNMSLRKDHPLVVVNCAAMPSALIESELFGREKGAYTGAITKQAGRFEIADGGTIFLDEIGELSAEIQAKLLRVLQEGEFEKLGSTKTISVDVRVIVATHRDLEKEVAAEKFRQDLYYRLNVFPITIPPLRERKDDIPSLVWSFVGEFSEKMGKRIESIPRKNMVALEKYSWPGNIRELRNVIERSMIRAQGHILQIQAPARAAASVEGADSLSDVEKQHILNVLKRTEWRIRGKNGASEILGLKPSTLESRMKKLGIKRHG